MDHIVEELLLTIFNNSGLSAGCLQLINLSIKAVTLPPSSFPNTGAFSIHIYICLGIGQVALKKQNGIHPHDLNK